MTQFEDTAQTLIRISNALIEAGQKRNRFARSIDHRLRQLFTRLGRVQVEEGVDMIMEKEMMGDLGQKERECLLGGRNRSRNYLRVEDVRDFLCVSRQNIELPSDTPQLPEQSLEEFVSLVNEQCQLEQQLRQELRFVELQKWFGEVDFFSNGYIDISALHEFLLHYSSSQESSFEEYNSMVLLKTIRKQPPTDKVEIQDIVDFIASEEDLLPVLLTENKIEAAPNEEATPVPDSLAINSMVSEFSLPTQIQLGKKLASAHEGSAKLLMTQHSFEGTGLPLRAGTFEERLVRLHPRNQKYITQAKMQMEGIIPFCAVQLESHLRMRNSVATQGETVQRLRLLSENYNKKAELVGEMLRSNKKWTFPNAFLLLDLHEQNRVTEEDWLKFAHSLSLNCQKRSLLSLYHAHSKNDCMRYSSFLKIFRSKATEAVMTQCLGRYPLLYESWSIGLMSSYKAFLEKLVRLWEEQNVLRDALRSRREDLRAIEESFSYAEQWAQLMGQEHTPFINEYHHDGCFNL